VSPPPDDKQLYFVTDDAMIISGASVEEAAKLHARALTGGRADPCVHLISQDGRTFHYQVRFARKHLAGQGEDSNDGVHFSMTLQGAPDV
jgi:hypothetical protein